MPISDWHVGQEVTVHFPHANQGAEKCRDTTISKIGKKYIQVDGLQTKLDASWEVPRGDQAELYTRNGYIEMLYVRKVILTFDKFKSATMSIALMLQLGDYLGIERPEHLRDDLSPELAQAIKRANL